MKESKLIKVAITVVAVAAFSLPAIASADTALKGKSEKVSFSDIVNCMAMGSAGHRSRTLSSLN